MNIPRSSIRRPLVLGLMLLLGAGAFFTASADELSATDQQFLGAYVRVHDALAADDLPGAVKAAGALPDNAGAPLAHAKSLSDARSAFAPLSVRAEKLAAGQPKYHVFYCPMANKDWVQTDPKVMNPYLGKDMLDCGEEKKKSAQ